MVNHMTLRDNDYVALTDVFLFGVELITGTALLAETNHNEV